MSGQRCDILNLEWSSHGRDVDIVEPVLSHLETRWGYSVTRASIMDYAGMLRRHNPRLFLISNQGGAEINFRATKLAHELGCKVATLISEGDYPRDAAKSRVEQFFWGWNRDRVCYEDLHLEWSASNLELIRRHIPEARDCDIRVSGATGFDRYAFMSFATKQEFLKRHGFSSFERVVGVAGWTFDHVLGDYFSTHETTVTEASGGKAGLELHRESCRLLREVWGQVIPQSPDTLFVLKHHPGVTQEEHSEFHGLEDLPNVLVLRGASENVADVISASDVWCAYESTTCLEAWLMGKQTVLVNPAGSDFPRSDIAAGSPKIGTVPELQMCLDRVFAGQDVSGWRDLQFERQTLVHDKIGWGDGLNHVRAAMAVRELLEATPARAPKTTDFTKEQCRVSRRLRILRGTGLVNLPRYASTKKYVSNMESRFDSQERETAAATYRRALTDFHSKNVDAVVALEQSEHFGDA